MNVFEAVEEYAPKLDKSAEQEQMARDVQDFRGEIEYVSGSVSTVAEVLAANAIEKAKRVEEGKKATPNLNKTISHKKSWVN